MSQPRVTVVGAANMDLVVRVPHIPAPGETVLGGDLLTAGGGKGANQAIAARRLGVDVFLVGRVGRDAFGEAALAALATEGVQTDYVTRDADAPSGVALISVADSGENAIAVAPGANARLSLADLTAAAPAFFHSRVAVFTLEVPLATVADGIRRAHDAGCLVVLNPAPVPAVGLPDEVLALVDVLNPNQHEAAALTGRSIRDRRDAIRVGQVLVQRGIRAVAITLGADGALLVTADRAEHVPGFPVTPVDTTGAGDAFTAGLAVALARARPVEEGVRWGCAAGALATTRLGAQPSMPTADEVERLLTAPR